MARRQSDKGVRSAVRFWIWLAFGIWIAAFSNPARAEYPERPVTLIVAVPPGGAGDLVARQFAARLAEPLGQNVIVENRGGAAGTIATAFTARAAADGRPVTAGKGIAPAISWWLRRWRWRWCC